MDPPVASPGETVTVTTSGTHPSGAPAAGARIRIHAGPEWQEGQPRVVGAADPDGRLEAQLAVPSPESASPATGLRVSAQYRSDALEEGWGAASVGLSGETLRMLVAAQGGALVPGRYGIIEVLVFDDRGLPVPARVTGELAGSRVALETGPDGVAELWAGSVPTDGSVLVELKATDGAGRTGSVRQTIPAAPPGSIVPVADRGIAHPGETLAVDLYSDRDGLALLDLVREGHTVYATSVRLMGGEARVYIPIDSRMTGTLGMRARWPDQPAPAALPALFVDPTRQADLSAPSGALDPGSNRAEIKVQLADGPWRGRVFGAITPVERPNAPADTDPALAWLALGTRALDMVAQDELNRLSLSWVRGDRPSLSRRPSRLFLSAAGVPSAEPRRATAGPGAQQAQIRERQQRLFRGLAFTLAVLAGLAFLGVLIGGELRVRSAAGLGEPEAASGYLRRLRTDLLLCGAALLVATAAAGHFHVRLASSGLPSPAVIRPQAANDLPTTGPTNDGLAPPCTVLQAHLPTGVVLPRSIDTGSPGGEMFLHMPDRPADFRCSALAVGSDGTLGFDEGFLTVRPLHIETLLVDGHGRKGEDVAVAVELTNRSPTEETAELRVSGVGARVTDGAESRVVVPPRTTLRAYATVVPETEGTVWVRAWAEWSDGESWQDSMPVAVTPQRSTVLVGAGAAGRGGARLPADGGTEGVGGHRVALVRGREALASQFVEALAPPWLTIDEPAWSLMISVRVLDVYGGPSESHRRWRVLARERIREAVLAILARRSGPAYGESPGAEADLRSSALALLALAEARPWSPQATAALPASRDGLLQLCFQAPEQMTDSERALAAWALARAGAARESVLPLLASAVREAEGQDEGATGPERLALAALAFHELGMDPEARGVAERLARVAQPLSGEEAVPGGESVMGSGERRAEAEVTALCALALERVDPPSPSRPTRQWLLRRLAELRGGDLLFGGASTNGLCGMALLDLMRDPQGDTTRVSVEQEGAQVIIDVPLDRWLDIPVERPAEEGAQTMRAIDSEPVHYVILAEASEPGLARAVTSVTPLGDGRTGQLSVTATNAEPSVMHRAELRVPLPPGLEPYLPDLADAAARDVIGAYVVEGGMVRCLLGDLAASDSVTLAFRVRAVRVPRVLEVQSGAELVPAGSGG
ncbi:MAG: hypothetical protein GF320_11840 [Armatimonadia bacterium]|nr:hypothetical protein [Armatimonadia bacterium]